MFQPFTISYHALQEDEFVVRIDANPGVPSQPNLPYYTLCIGAGRDLGIFLSDAQCLQIMDALNSRPPLPKTDAQIDAEAEEARGELPPYQHQVSNAR